VSLDELLDALEYVSFASVGTLDAAAYVSRDTGSVYFVGTDMELKRFPKSVLPCSREVVPLD